MVVEKLRFAQLFITIAGFLRANVSGYYYWA